MTIKYETSIGFEGEGHVKDYYFAMLNFDSLEHLVSLKAEAMLKSDNVHDIVLKLGETFYEMPFENFIAHCLRDRVEEIK